jgi:hypothetical protein
MKKITKATLKGFIKKNEGNLYIHRRSSFDSMTDGLTYSRDKNFKSVKKSELKHAEDHDLGISGVWLVGAGRDSFGHYEDNEFIGIDAYNSCGSFIVAIKKLNLTKEAA